PTPEQRKPTIMYNLRNRSVGQGGFAEQYPSRDSDDESNEPDVAESMPGGQRHMFMHPLQEIPANLSLPLRDLALCPFHQHSPPAHLDQLHADITALLPGQRGARVVYNGTYRRAGRPLRWLR